MLLDIIYIHFGTLTDSLDTFLLIEEFIFHSILIVTGQGSMLTGGCGLFYPVARCLGVPKQFWRFMRFARSVIFMIYNKTCSTTLESNVGNLKKLEEFIIYSILIVTGQGSMSTGGCGLFYPVAGPSPFDHMQKLIVTKYSASHLENTSLFNTQ